jgi:hypothetical protein
MKDVLAHISFLWICFCADFKKTTVTGLPSTPAPRRSDGRRRMGEEINLVGGRNIFGGEMTAQKR